MTQAAQRASSSSYILLTIDDGGTALVQVDQIKRVIPDGQGSRIVLPHRDELRTLANPEEVDRAIASAKLALLEERREAFGHTDLPTTGDDPATER